MDFGLDPAEGNETVLESVGLLVLKRDGKT
jgi:hypothetical protein